MSFLRQVADIMGGSMSHHKLRVASFAHLLVSSLGWFLHFCKEILLSSRYLVFCSFYAVISPWEPEIPRLSCISPLFSLCNDTINEGLFHSLLVQESAPSCYGVEVWQGKISCDGGSGLEQSTVWSSGSISHKFLILHFWGGNIQLLAKTWNPS